MSDTPRTDEEYARIAKIESGLTGDDLFYEMTNFASQLERELQEAKELLVQTSDYLELINMNKKHKRDIDKFLEKGEE